jgi:hypothetical protein
MGFIILAVGEGQSGCVLFAVCTLESTAVVIRSTDHVDGKCLVMDLFQVLMIADLPSGRSEFERYFGLENWQARSRYSWCAFLLGYSAEKCIV